MNSNPPLPSVPLPMVAALTSRPWVSLTNGVPFVGSSPMERSPTVGAWVPKRADT